MGFWKKKDRVHFERDSQGKVVEVVYKDRTPEQVEQAGDTKGLKSSRQLMMEYYSKHPDKRPGAKLRAGVKRLDDRIVKYNRNSNMFGPGRPRKPYSTQGNYNPFGSMFDTGMTPARKPKSKNMGKGKTKYVVVGGKAYPVVGAGKKTKSKSKSKTKSRSDPFDQWGLFK